MSGFRHSTRRRRRAGRRRTGPVLVVSTQGARLLREDARADAILTLDRDGYIRSAGAGTALARQFPAEDVVGRHVSRFYTAEEVASGRLARALAAAAKDGTHAESGWRLRADGSRFWADTVITAIRDAGTHVSGYSVVLRDMTGHRQHLQRLHAVAEVNQKILDGGAGDEVLTLIARRVRETVGADAALVMALDWGDVLTVRAAAGVEAGAPRSLPRPEESDLACAAIRSGRPGIFSETDRKSPDGRSALHDAGLASVLTTPLTVHGRPVGVIQLVNRTGGRGFTLDDVQAVGLFAGPAGLVIEQARTHEDLRRLACTAVVGQDTLLQTLDTLATSAVERTNSASCTVYLLEPGQTLRLVGGHVSDARPPCGPPGPLGTSPGKAAMEAIASAAPVIQDDRRGLAAGRDSHLGRRPRRARWGAVACVPLLRHGQAIGAMCCSFPEGRRPGDRDLTVLEMIAGQAASAVEHDRLRTAAEETAVLEERHRLSRELHDSVSQALYGIAMGARTARELLDHDVAKAAEPIEYVRHLADVGMAEMRAVLGRLRPESLETEGLVASLAQQVEALRTRYGIEAEAMLGAEPDTSPEAKHALYRIAQESLHNAAKHSGARHVLLRLLTGPDSVTLLVTDDGVGFDPQGSFPGHLGLRSMRERAREVGGTLKVDSRPGQGSRIRATVPAQP